MQTPLTWLDDWMAVDSARETIPLDLDCLDLSPQPPQAGWAYRLQQLTVQGFERWLQEREPSLPIAQLDRATDATAAIASLQVGAFRVCLIPTDLTDDEVAIPQTAVDHPDHAAHFYVAVAIDEEAEVASLVGFLPYDQLAARCADLTVDVDQTYPVPSAELNSEPDTLLLFLQCLAPSAIPLPSRATVAQLERPSLVETLRLPLTNASTWLQQQFDTLLPVGGWQPIPAAALRLNTGSVQNPLTAALQQLPAPILPAEAGTAYQTVALGNSTLRLFAAVWPVPDTAGDWMLLTVVCPLPGQAFPLGLSLAIDEITPGSPRVTLAHETLAVENQSTILFAQVKGNRHDVFDIVIAETGRGQSWSTAIQFRVEA